MPSSRTEAGGWAATSASIARNATTVRPSLRIAIYKRPRRTVCDAEPAEQPRKHEITKKSTCLISSFVAYPSWVSRVIQHKGHEGHKGKTRLVSSSCFRVFVALLCVFVAKVFLMRQPVDDVVDAEL